MSSGEEDVVAGEVAIEAEAAAAAEGEASAVAAAADSGAVAEAAATRARLLSEVDAHELSQGGRYKLAAPKIAPNDERQLSRRKQQAQTELKSAYSLSSLSPPPLANSKRRTGAQRGSGNSASTGELVRLPELPPSPTKR